MSNARNIAPRILHQFSVTRLVRRLLSNFRTNGPWPSKKLVEGLTRMSRHSPPRKLNLDDIISSPTSISHHHHSQGIAALFAITFDLRAGYTITWQQPEDMNLSGVEFKSMPSGLHNIDEDLVYFVMPPYAGLSAYYRQDASDSERNARMVAIGILVPSTGRYGRLGRAWNHASQLKELARLYADNPDDMSHLKIYFNSHYDPTIPTSAYPITPITPSSPRHFPSHLHSRRQQAITRKRSVSDIAAPFRGLKLSPFHPAMIFPDFVTTFGPLIFVLYRAALCRKRILFLAPVPVERTCHFVYNASVLATIPPSVSDLLISEPNRLRTLFSIGVSDIPMLERLSLESGPQLDNSSILTDSSENTNEQGWVACTTDAVLALKPHLYDILVTLPHKNAFPSILGPKSDCLKIPAGNNHPVLTSSTGARLRLEMPLPKLSGPDPDFDELLYQRTWTEFICGGLCWWATAGEAAYNEDFDINEVEDDYFLTGPPARRGTLGEGVPLLQRSDTFDSIAAQTPEDTSWTRARSDISRISGFEEADVGSIVYFHRMTARMMSSLSAIIDANELEEGDEEQPPATKVSTEDLMRMGLDWTEREFVKEMCMTWFGREIIYETHRSECCY